MEENNQNPDKNEAGVSAKDKVSEPGHASLTERISGAAAPETDLQSFGDWLKSHRIQKKISLEEIAAVTKVHIQQFKSLEENEVSKLPAPAFVRGFLVSYARHLGIDEDSVLERYKSSFGGSLTPLADQLMPLASKSARSASAPKVAMVSAPQMKGAPATREVEKQGGSSFSFKNISLTIGIIGLIALIATLITIGKRERVESQKTDISSEEQSEERSNESSLVGSPTSPPTSNAIPSSPVASKELPVAKAESTPSSTPSSTPTPAPSTPPPTPAAPVKAAAVTPVVAPTSSVDPSKKYQLEIRAIDGNFVHLRVDDAAPKGITLKNGQSHVASVDTKAVLTISDAGNLEIRWNGIWYATPGYRGDLKVITLPDQIASLTAKAATPKPVAKPKAPLTPEATSSSPPAAE